MGNVASEAAGAGDIAQKYHFQKVKLGEGSFGTVWRAVEKQSGAVVAIKQMRKDMMPKKGMRTRDVQREIAMMKACHQEHVLGLLDTFEDESSIYMAVEYCDGGDFGDKIKELGRGLSEAELASWMWQICSAIAELHLKSICHRDIKPDNFMVSGQCQILKLADFGLAIFAPGNQFLKEKCGTPAMMAPEQQALPNNSPGYWLPVDMWGAGLTMYMLMLGGTHPFIDSSGRFDGKKAENGTLDFGEQTSFLGSLGGKADGLVNRPKPHPPAAMVLCRRLVNPDPTQRLTAQDALQEPWLIEGQRNLNQRRASSVQEPPQQPHSFEVQPMPAQQHQSAQLQDFRPDPRNHLPEQHAPPGFLAARATMQQTKEFEELQLKLRCQQHDNSERQQELVMKDAALAALKLELARTEQAHSTGVQSLTQELSRRDADIGQHVAELIKLRSELTSNIRTQCASGEGKDAEVSLYIQALAQRDAALAQRDQDLSSKDCRLSKLQESLLQKDSEIAGFRQELEECKAESDLAKASAATSAAAAESAAAEVAECQRRAATSAAAAESAAAEVAECQRRMNACQTEEIQAQLKTAASGTDGTPSQQLDRLRDEVANKDVKITHLEEALARLNEKIANRESDVARRDAELSQRDSELAKRESELQKEPATQSPASGTNAAGKPDKACCATM